MPHFVFECNEDVIQNRSVDSIIQEIHSTAEDSGLFHPDHIKVRLNAYKSHTCGPQDEDFIHIFGSIMEGRTTAQKRELSESMVKKCIQLFPDVPNIAMNVWEFEKATYIKRTMVESI